MPEISAEIASRALDFFSLPEFVGVWAVTSDRAGWFPGGDGLTH
jgi:hypothetical protein